MKRVVVIILVFSSLLTGCVKKEEQKLQEGFRFGVFVPGVLEGSPTYQMMDQGIRESAALAQGSVQTIEGGFNQAEWQSQVMNMAASGEFDLIVTSNPAMPELCREVKKQFSNQEFLILEGSSISNDTVSTVIFRHEELAFTLGYFAGLVTASDMPGANKALKVGLIAGQVYPEMAKKIKPGFNAGLLTAAPQAELDFRVVGNWYDAAKASDLAAAMYSDGVDIIMTIAGGANHGVVSAAREKGAYVLWYDTDGYSIAPGTVIGSGILYEDRAAREQAVKALEGKLEPGSSEVVGIQEGYVDFLDTSDGYKDYVSKSVQQEMAKVLKELREGSLIVKKPVITK